jgi:hypothetical protein
VSERPERQGRAGSVALVVLVLLTVASVAFALFSWLHWRDLDQRQESRKDAKAAAAAAIPAFTSFDYTRMEADIARARTVMTPCFGKQYGETLAASIPTATQAKAVVTVQVQAAQTLTVRGSTAAVLVFFDQKAEFGDGRATKVTPYRVVLEMRKTKGRWLVNFLDLGDAGATGKRDCG